MGKHLPGGLQLGGDAVTAHPHVDPLTGRLVLYSYRIRLGAGAPPAPAGAACSAGKQAPQQPCCQPAGGADLLSRQSLRDDMQPTPGRRGGLAGCKRSRQAGPEEGVGSQQGPAGHPHLQGTGGACRLGRLSGALGWAQGLGQLTTELTFHEFDQASQAECNRCQRHCRGSSSCMMHHVPVSACMPPRRHHSTVLAAPTAMHRWHPVHSL